jgi:AcrR family transcriptional regulator
VVASKRESAPRDGGAKRLDVDTIVRAGLTLGAKRGVDAISVRALGAELGVDPTAVYRHFRNKDDLMRALMDALHVMALDRMGDAGSWQERIVEFADATLQVHVEYPAIVIEANGLTTGGPGEARTIEFILEAFGDAGLSDADIVRHYAVLGSFMLSRTASIARTRSLRSDDSDAWIDGPLLLDPVRQPRAAALVAELSALTDDDIYVLGIRSIIESAERAAASTEGVRA